MAFADNPRAVIEGVLSTAAPVFGVIDADLQHDETVLPAMLARLRGESGQAAEEARQRLQSVTGEAEKAARALEDAERGVEKARKEALHSEK